MSMYTCTKCQKAQSWNEFTEGICDTCWDEKNELTEKLLIAIEAVGIKFMEGAQYGEMSPLHENILCEYVDDIAELLIKVKKENL